MTEEQLKEIRQQIDVSYEEAERYIDKSNGDVDLAVKLILERKKTFHSKMKREGKRLLKELLSYYLKIEKGNMVYINLPLLFFILFLLFAGIEAKIWVLIIGLGAVFMSESKVSIFKRKKKEDIILVKEHIDTSSDENKKEDKDTDDFNEFTINK